MHTCIESIGNKICNNFVPNFGCWIYIIFYISFLYKNLHHGRICLLRFFFNLTDMYYYYWEHYTIVVATAVTSDIAIATLLLSHSHILLLLSLKSLLFHPIFSTSIIDSFIMSLFYYLVLLRVALPLEIFLTVLQVHRITCACRNG